MRKFRFFQNCGTFNTNQNKKYHNFERNEIRTTVFLKWTDFTYPFLKKSPNFVDSTHFSTSSKLCICTKDLRIWSKLECSIIALIASFIKNVPCNAQKFKWIHATFHALIIFIYFLPVPTRILQYLVEIILERHLMKLGGIFIQW